MKIDFDAPLFMPDGKTPLKLDAEGEAVTTLKIPVAQALLTNLGGDELTPLLKYRLYTLHHRLRDGGEHELDVNDIDLVEKRLMVLFATFIFGQCSDLLNGRTQPVDRPLPTPAPTPTLPDAKG